MSYQMRVMAVVVLIELTGFYTLNALGYESYSMWFFILFLLAIFLMPSSFGKIRYKAERENLVVPEKFQAKHQELLALGFELDCLLITTTYFLPKRQWFYFHKLEGALAYISEESSQLWFSSYFEKGFDVTTRFQHGEALDNNKIVSHIVKTSIPAAFDYHLQHRQKYLSQYGAILFFKSAEQQIEWELGQKVDKAIKREAGLGVMKLFGRFILATIALVLVFIVLSIGIIGYLAFTMPERVTEIGEIWTQGYALIAPLIAIAWAIWPSIFPKSVEERKKKEASKNETR